MMISGFILANLTMAAIILGFTIPRYYDAFIPMERRDDGTEPTVAMETKNEISGAPIGDLARAESGQLRSPCSSSPEPDHESATKVKETAGFDSRS
jgi:solute carrier family 6 GABA transporter-like protein 1